MAGGGRIRKDNTPDFNDMTTKESQIHFEGLKDQRKSRKGLSLKKYVDLDEVNEKLLNVLFRDTEHLLKDSLLGKLSRDDSQSVVNYLKLIKDLKKIEASEEDNKTDEELEKLANEPITSEESPSQT